MTTRALLLVLAALVAAPAALASGGPMYTLQGGLGIAAPKGGSHYVAVPTSAGDTTLLAVAKDGSVRSWASVVGSYGIPMVTYRDAGGLSRDGRTLFLQSVTYGGPSSTSFVVVNTRSMAAEDAFFLKGSFAFDALSPDGRRLYLTQRVDVGNPSRYVVRAYDLTRDRLLPGRIADPTQRRWVMQGDAVARAVSSGGRWVYTLYQNAGGYPFVHALDTVRGVAHCIGVPWRSADQSPLANVDVVPTARGFELRWRSGRRWLAVDRTSWRVDPTPAGSGAPWAWLVPAAALLVAAAILVRLLRRRSGGTALPREA